MTSSTRATQTTSSASRIALVIAGLAAATLLQAAPASANVFGKDPRVKVTSAKYPYSTLGKLDGEGASGTLVGRRLVLTAAHCIIDTKTHQLFNDLTTFSVGVVNGKARDSANMIHFWWGTTDPDNDREHDWALILLDKPLGDKYGWMGVDAEDIGRKYSTVAVAGYSTDRYDGNTATIDFHCHIREFGSGFWLHDGSATRGSSGCPLFVNTKGGAQIVALNVGEFRNNGDVSLFLNHYDKDHANIAVRTGEFLPKLNELMAQYNQPEPKVETSQPAESQPVATKLAVSQPTKSPVATRQLAKTLQAKKQRAKLLMAKSQQAKTRQADHQQPAAATARPQAAARQSSDAERT